MHLPLFWFPFETKPGPKQKCNFFFDVVVDIGEFMNIRSSTEIVFSVFHG